jgi:hypothetical protein
MSGPAPVGGGKDALRGALALIVGLPVALIALGFALVPMKDSPHYRYDEVAPVQVYESQVVLGSELNSHDIQQVIAYLGAHLDRDDSLGPKAVGRGVTLNFDPESEKLYSVVFNSPYSGYAAIGYYTGPLPSGLSFSDTRRMIEIKVGKPNSWNSFIAGKMIDKYTQLHLEIYYAFDWTKTDNIHNPLDYSRAYGNIQMINVEAPKQ